MDATLSSRQRRCAAATLFSILAVTLPASSFAADENLWTPQNTRVLVTGPMRLNLGFVNQTGEPTTAIVSSLPTSALQGMPPGLESAGKSPLLNWSDTDGGYFETMWSSIRGDVCTDVQNAILKQVNQSPNTAYDTQPCHMNTRGGLLVTFQTNWAGSDVLQPNGHGRRLLIDYKVPLNGVIFWVTSPHTCHRGSPCPTEPQDPVFSLIFTVDITVTCTSQAPAEVPTIPLPISCTSSSSIVPDAVLGGNVTGQLDAAATKWVKQLAAEGASVAASGGSSLPAAAAAAVVGAVNVAVKGIGAAIAAISDQHLRDFVSSSLTIVASYTAATSADNASAAFARFFQDLYGADLAGLKPFDVLIGPHLSLNFGLVYPPAARPTLENATKAQNTGSIISPMIAVTQPQVQPGQTIPVKATFFRATYVNELDISWNRTVLGNPVSKLKWGPPPATVTIPALAFQATDLKPATVYRFAVQECDTLTCSPFSEILVTKTEGAAAGDVVFWLDSNTSQHVGSAPLASGGGSFIANITIPVSTTPGQHMLNAAAPGQPTATAPLNVCARGGCGASVALVNTSNNTLYPSGWRVEISYPVTLRGSQFTPGGVAAIYLDAASGAKIGSAPVGPLGHFQLTFNMPRVAQGSHNFIAIEGGAMKAAPIPGHPLHNLMLKQQAGRTIEASVNVEVQAAAQ